MSVTIDTDLSQVNQRRQVFVGTHPPVVIIGAGIGGLAAAIDLAASGQSVLLLEKAATPGGKLRQVSIAGRGLDAGPTVFTLRHLFDELFALANTTLEQHLHLQRATTLARHVWPDGSQLDLFANPEQTEQALHAFSGAHAARDYQRFVRESQRQYTMLEHTFLRRQRPTPVSLTRAMAQQRLTDLLYLKPFTQLATLLARRFSDPRLQQLFGRYATYCGSSPYLAPATLMLIAHVERAGVWLLTEGMHELAQAMLRIATQLGVSTRFGSEVRAIEVIQGQATGVLLANGERIAAHAVICNGDAAALSDGSFGSATRHAVADMTPRQRSLSAITWNVLAHTRGRSLLHHTVFFANDYAREFSQLIEQQRLADEATVYICAQDRDDHSGMAPDMPERLLCLINAPALGDHAPLSAQEIDSCTERTMRFLSQCGLQLSYSPSQCVITTPTDFHRLFPGTGGALYGRASHGWQASFQRPSARTKIAKLYLAGGSAHPGAGVPMAALSGRLAAAACRQDCASTTRFHAMATPGGISTRSLMTAKTESPSSPS